MIAPPLLGSTAARGLTESAHRRLRKAVIECELAPAATVSQEELAAGYGLTKAAVRGALARLEQEGLVQPLPRRGYRIAPITLRDFEEIFTLRELVEPVVTRLAAGRVGMAELARLADLASATFRSGDLESQRRYLQANRDFHVGIALYSDNSRLLRLMEQVLDESLRMTFLTMHFEDDSEAWRQGHLEILGALARGDGEGAERICRAELLRGRADMRRAVLGSREIQGVNIRGPHHEGTKAGSE